MDSKISVLETDAIPQYLPVDTNENQCNRSISLKSLCKDFTIDDYKSALFLLMDYVEFDNFLNYRNKESLQQFFEQLYYCKVDNCNILVELFGTMKKYKLLRLLNTCHCRYKNANHIDAFRKMLYSLCEELTDHDLVTLKETVPDRFRTSIVTAEDWFCWCLKNNIFSKTDLSKLGNIFRDHASCLKIIDNFQVAYIEKRKYCIRTPYNDLPCGIALIINYDKFDEKSKLRTRRGSLIDVDSLQHLWKTFGLKTVVRRNLTYTQTLKELEFYATLDHSNYNLFVCCILSHGKSNSIYSSDAKEIPIPVLMSEITNNCSSLVGKPKLFFIQACQGTNIYQGPGQPVYKQNKDETPELPLLEPIIDCDVLRVTSSIDGFASFRNVETGSWFINALCASMMEYGDKWSILDIMTEVNSRVQKYSTCENYFGSGELKNAQQIVPCSHTLTKILILKKCIE